MICPKGSKRLPKNETLIVQVFRGGANGPWGEERGGKTEPAWQTGVYLTEEHQGGEVSWTAGDAHLAAGIAIGDFLMTGLTIRVVGNMIYPPEAYEEDLC